MRKIFLKFFSSLFVLSYNRWALFIFILRSYSLKAISVLGIVEGHNPKMLVVKVTNDSTPNSPRVGDQISVPPMGTELDATWEFDRIQLVSGN